MAGVPNSTNIDGLLKSFEDVTSYQAQMAGAIKGALNSARSFATIKVDGKVKEGLKSMKNVKKTFNEYSVMIADMATGIVNMVPKSVSLEDMRATLEYLAGDPENIETLVNADGSKTERKIGKKSGLIDILSTTVGLFKSLSEVKAPDQRQLKKTIKACIDISSYITSFVVDLGKGTDQSAMLDASTASKNIVDASAQMIKILDGIDKTLIPMAEKLYESAPFIKGGLLVLCNDNEKEFSIVRNLAAASETMGKINKDGVKNFVSMIDSMQPTIKDMIIWFGLLGISTVHDVITNGIGTLSESVSSMNRIGKKLEKTDAAAFEKMVMFDKAAAAAKSMTQFGVQSVQSAMINSVFAKIAGTEPGMANMFNYMFGWLSDLKVPTIDGSLDAGLDSIGAAVGKMCKIAEDLSKSSSTIVASFFQVEMSQIALRLMFWSIGRTLASINKRTYDMDKAVQAASDLSYIALYLNAFTQNIPRRRAIKRAVNGLAAIAEVLSDPETKDNIIEACIALDEISDRLESFKKLGDILQEETKLFKVAALAGVFALPGIVGMLLIKLSLPLQKALLEGIIGISEGFDKQKIKDAADNIENMTLLVACLGLSMAVMALVGVLVLKAAPLILLGFIAIAATAIALFGLIKILDMLFGETQFRTSADSIRNMGLLVLLAGAVIVIALLVGMLVLKAFVPIMAGLVMLGIVCVGLIGLMYLMAKVGENPGLKKGMIFFLIMVGSLLIAALMIKVVSSVGESLSFVGVLKFSLALMVMVGLFAGIGALLAYGGIALVLMATVGLLLISVSMMMMAGALKVVNKVMDGDTADTAKENIVAMLDCFKEVVTYLNDNISAKDVTKAAYKMTMLSMIAGRLTSMAKRISKIASLTMQEFDEQGHPTGEVVQMKADDFVRAAMNAVAVATTIAAVLSDEPTVIQTADSKFTVTGLSQATMDKINVSSKRKMRQLSKITKHLARMAATVTGIASLKYATAWGPDGQPTEYQKMETDDFIRASVNGVAVATTIASIFDDKPTQIQTADTIFTVTGLSQETLDKINTKSKRKMRQLAKITGHIANMAETVCKIASLKIATEWNAEGKPINFQAVTADQMKGAAINGIAIAQIFAAMASNTDSTVKFYEDGNMTEFTVTALSENVFEKVDREMKRKFRFLNQIVTCIANATKTIVDLASLRVPNAWDKDGKPISYQPISTTEMQDATVAVVNIMTTLTDAVTSDEMTNKLDNFDRKKAKNLERVFGVISPISDMVNAVIALAGGSMEEYDADGHPTGKQISVMTALEAKPDIINGIVSIYGVFLDALAAITGQEAETEQAVASGGSWWSKAAAKVAGAVKAVVSTAVSAVNNIKARIDTNTIQKQVTGVIDPISDMIETVKKLNTVMTETNMEATGNFPVVIAGMVAGLETIPVGITERVEDFAATYKAVNKFIETVKHLDETMKSVDPNSHQLFNELLNGSIGAVTKAAESDYMILERRMESLGKYIDLIRKFNDANRSTTPVKNVERTMDATGKFIVKLNKVSDNKLEKMATIAKNMADFARRINGNFDKLADAMNEKMVTALDKVDKTLKEVNKTMNEMPGKMKSAVSNITVTGGGGSDADKKGDDKKGGNAPAKGGKTREKSAGTGTNITGKSISNCIVQASDGTIALAIVQKSE